jgi:cytochrome c-type biogenesis protein CcmE
MASPLDRELQRALADKDKDNLAVEAGPRPAKKGNFTLLAVLLTMAVGIVALVMTSFKDAAVYAKTVDQLLADRDHLAGRRVRVEGMLVHGTLERRDQPCEYRFTMEKNGTRMNVRYPQCVVPDTFRDVPGMDVGVTVEGKLASGSEGDFLASTVMAKCPSKYEMKQQASQGVQAPHAPMLNN